MPQTNSIRMIAGKWRGRKIPVINIDAVRPTTDRIRETVFNWLMPYLHNARCLDAYAGTGVLGFEALSRGAAHVSFVESHPHVSKQLTKTKDMLDAEEVNIINTDFLNSAGNLQAPYSLVFLDPPFAKNMLNASIDYLLNNNLLNPNAIIYIEHNKNDNALNFPDAWELLKQKIAGDVCYALYSAK